MTDQELKKEFESSRGQWISFWVGLVFLIAWMVVLAVLLIDPLKWFDGPPAVHQAKKWLALSFCFVWVPVLVGIWFMLIRPLQTGIASGGSKYRAPYIVLRSEQPARFRAEIGFNCVLLVVGLVFGIYLSSGLFRELKKAQAEASDQIPVESKMSTSPSGHQ